MIIYCAHAGCGSKNEYSGAKPKFCGRCGNPFDAAFARVAPAVAAPAALPRQYAPAPAQQQPGVILNHLGLPQLDPDSIKVQTESSPGKLTLGDVVNGRGGEIQRYDAPTSIVIEGERKVSAKEAFVAKARERAEAARTEIVIPKRRVRKSSK